jgi:hypothetical protein
MRRKRSTKSSGNSRRKRGYVWHCYFKIFLSCHCPCSNFKDWNIKTSQLIKYERMRSCMSIAFRCCPLKSLWWSFRHLCPERAQNKAHSHTFLLFCAASAIAGVWLADNLSW